MSRLTRSFQNFEKQKITLNRDGSVKSHEGTRRSQSKLEHDTKLVNNERENKFSKSFYGDFTKISLSEKQLNPIYGGDGEVLYNTLELKNHEHPSRCYLNTINGCKRSRVNNFSASKINNTKEQSLNRLAKLKDDESKLNNNE